MRNGLGCVVPLVVGLSLSHSGCADRGGVRLTCTVEKPRDGPTVVRWRLVNGSPSDIWVPDAYGRSHPCDTIPAYFVVPEDTLMLVSGFFKDPIGSGFLPAPGVYLAVRKLVAGGIIEGVATVPDPFSTLITHDDKDLFFPDPADLVGCRWWFPNVFCPRNHTQQPVALHMPAERGRIRRLQMAIQVFRDDPALRSNLGSIRRSTDPSGILAERAVLGLMPLLHDLREDPKVFGTYMARCLTGFEAPGRARIDDLGEWVVSPFHPVDIALSKDYPRIGVP